LISKVFAVTGYPYNPGVVGAVLEEGDSLEPPVPPDPPVPLELSELSLVPPEYTAPSIIFLTMSLIS